MKTTRSLQEVLFVAHFSGAPPIGVLDIADWHNCFAESYPIFQQQPPWQPIAWQDIYDNQGTPPIPQVMFNQFILPRMVLSSEDQRWSIHFQGDRVAMGWRRTEPTGQNAAYPGFEVAFETVLGFFEKFIAWWGGRISVPIAFHIAELNYFNAFPLALGGQSLKVSEIFRFITPQRDKKVLNLQCSWIEPLEDITRQARVNCSVGFGPTIDSSIAALFNFMGISKLDQSGSPDELETVFKSLHDAITNAYISAINTEIIGNQE
jgi:uncharacterized protein (TIGR04255 family)